MTSIWFSDWKIWFPLELSTENAIFCYLKIPQPCSNERKSSNLVKGHELICHFIRGHLVPLASYDHTNLWVAKKNSHTHTCAHTRTCAMCVRKSFLDVRAMCVRAALFKVCDVRSHICSFSHTFALFCTLCKIGIVENNQLGIKVGYILLHGM
jgi:hypothetical protein